MLNVLLPDFLVLLFKVRCLFVLRCMYTVQRMSMEMLYKDCKINACYVLQHNCPVGNVDLQGRTALHDAGE